MVIIVCNIARIAGLSYHNTMDATWETFWQYISASIGLILTSVAAFRSLFVSHRIGNNRQEISDLEALRRLYAKIKQVFKKTFSIQQWRTGLWYSNERHTSKDLEAHAGRDWGKIEHGTITGLRSFIREYRHMPATVSEIMSSQIREEVDDHIDKCSLLVDTVAGSCSYNDVANNDGGSRHGKMLAQTESHRHDKILVSQGSSKHDKMLAREATEEQDKILAINGNNENGALILNKPARVRHEPKRYGDDSILETNDSNFGTSSRWLQDSANAKARPKARIGFMSKIKCGGLVFSAGFKAERYRAEE